MHANAGGLGGEDRTIRFRFRIVVSLLCVILVAVSVWSFLSDRRSSDERTTRETTLLSRALSKHAGDLMSVVNLLQFEMVATVERIRSGEIGSETAAADWRARLSRLDAVEGICAFDRAGRMLVATGDDCAEAPASAWFKPYPAIGGTVRQIGLPVLARDASGWLIPTIHVWYDERARPAGLVVVMLRSKGFLSVYDTYAGDGQLGIALYRADGILLSRFPERPESVGRNFGGSGLLRPAFGQQSGVIFGVSPIDGVDRIRSFNRVPNTALIVVVALTRGSSAFWSRTGLASTLLLLFLIGLVSLVSRQLDNHLESASDSRERMKVQARTDALTGLPNRRALDEAISREWRTADQNFSSLSMLLIDVDHFKLFNDTYGHQAGDECLRRVAFALRQASFETIAHLARYGGEEFAILLIDVTPNVAMLIARHLKAQIETLAIPHKCNGEVGVVTVSIGLSTLDFASPLGNSTPISLVSEADQALYVAKRSGRNRVEQFSRPVAEVVALRA